MRAWLPALAAGLLASAAPALADDSQGPGGAPHRVHALVGPTVIPRPGERIEGATLVIRDGIIAALGRDVEVPGDARVWDLRGMTVYAGLIEPYLRREEGSAPSGHGKPSQPSAQPGARHPNPLIRPERSQARELHLEGDELKALRGLGFTSALVVPGRGIFRGTSALVNLRDGEAREQVVKASVAQHLAFDTARGGAYPGSLMGAMALARQTLLDAEHALAADVAYRRAPMSQERPPGDLSLRALRPSLTGELPVCFEAPDAQAILRGTRLLGEFELVPWVVTDTDAYRWLDAVSETAASLVVSLNFPPAPRWETEGELPAISTEAFRHWHLAVENPGRLEGARVPFALTTQGLPERGAFRERVRRALDAGLSEDAALAAFTTAPAALFGTPQLGVLTAGAIANLTVTDGPLFAEETQVLEVWVDGARYPSEHALPRPPELAGTWSLSLMERRLLLHLTHEDGRLNASVEPELPASPATEGETEESAPEPAPLDEPELWRERLSLVLPGVLLGQDVDVPLVLRVRGRVMHGRWRLRDEVSGDALARLQSKAEDKTDADDEGPEEGEPERIPVAWPAEWPPQPEAAPAALHIRNATIWTLGPQGTLENAELLCEEGRIVAVGYQLEAPPGAQVVDAAGRHVTPGIVDAHNHSFIVGDVNEWTHNCSAEVRIGDVVDGQTVRIYQQLAGGVTTANLLHGSANAIGGQSAVVQLRWGQTPQRLLFREATPNIKFALGENPKRSNWGQELPSRYPASRMGVLESIRERFSAARDYKRERQAWNEAPAEDRVPPRLDLQLEALAEILDGRRLIHCHSYRQDEILALIRLAEDFGITIGVFQHVLEGYKVADEIAAHGAGASTFSDWWAYKFEVYDAIAYNGALMHERGVLVSFNSDSSEMARRLNQEAAKAVRWGGTSPEEALKFVTLNPAIQLGVGERTGSLEVGKQADLVLWSDHPLSIAAICDETWIAGRRYYARERDRLSHALADAERLRLREAARRERGRAGAIDPGSWRPTFAPPPQPESTACCGEEGR